ALQAAQQLAEVLGDAARVAHTLICMTLALTHAGRTEEAVRTGQRCGELADQLEEEPMLQIAARHQLGQAEWASGSFHRAADRLRVNIQALKGDLIRERSPGMGPFPAVLSRFYLSRCLIELGDYAKPRRRSRRRSPSPRGSTIHGAGSSATSRWRRSTFIAA